MVNRRKFISDSLKISLGVAIGVRGAEYVERFTPYGLKSTEQQLEFSDNWWIEPPINPNGDFSEGTKYWKGGFVGEGEAKDATAGIRIYQNDHGEVWLDNRDSNAVANTALLQGADSLQMEAGIHLPNWFLRTHHLMLEADVRIDFDEPYSKTSWSRVAIGTWIQRTCILQHCTKSDLTSPLYFNIKGNQYSRLYTEYDVYRRNVPFLGYNAVARGGDTNEYPADQLPFGYWKPMKIDLNEFITNGYNMLGAWGQENHDMAMLSAWYLVPEAEGSRVQASWRRIKIYSIQT